MTVHAEDPFAACDREPIHIPGSIQPHGHLLAFEPRELRLAHASAAAGPVLGRDPAQAFGRRFAELFAAEAAPTFEAALRALPNPGVARQLGPLCGASGEAFQAIAHRSPDGFVVLELETMPEDSQAGGVAPEALYPAIRDAFDRLRRAISIEELTAVAAAEVRRLTGFDRVLAYRFEPNWDGVVVAEDRNDRLPSYLGLRFPASDIPAPARRLYELNPQRLIADMDYAPVPILAARAEAPPLDLTFATLRSVSPVHLEYMRNMGTPASMSISLLREDRLWGLLSCHHAAPRRVPFALRNACDLIGQMLSVRVAAEEATAHAEARSRLKGLEGRLLARMAMSARFPEGLAAVPADLLGLAGATGAAVLTMEGCILVGRAPPEAAVRRIAAWLSERGVEEVFHTIHLAAELPEMAEIADRASGLLAVPVSRLHPSYVMWFRPELVRTVSWGGDPRKPAAPAPDRLHPRRSFEIWKETVRRRAAPWSAAEIEAARDLRSAILRIVLRHAEERAALTDRLERINEELTAFSYSVSHDLRAPFRHIIGFAELLRELEGNKLSEKGRRFLATITEAAENAGALVDALLAFSQMGRARLNRAMVDTEVLVAEVIRSLAQDIGERRVTWRVGALPMVRGDPVMLRQVFQNLLSNAVKYTRGRDEAVIAVGCELGEREFLFSVQDNGTGFDMAYAGKLFGVFQRLHRMEEFEGIGIGLANVRRIVERHGGRVWARGEPDRGATFFFTLPRREEAEAQEGEDGEAGQ
ncbi:ATP-binding protein [Crenalkalicoccus roseus]|uniref:ATP-binding protein n=1 Tax=Crenalkalicoccus roseus TaxID=1485588 RepID=UPI001080B98B|nr:ATP-binding protein [Crenalkalicoccus roseus]